MKLKGKILIAATGAIVIGAGIAVWHAKAAATKIAFVNYQTIALAQIAKANDNSSVRISELSADELHKAADYDMVFVNGMGLRITDEQRAALATAAQEGTPVLTTAATNPQNYIVSVDSVDAEFMKQYLAGGRANYRNMLRYVRRFVDGKTIFAPMPADPQVPQSSLLYYPSASPEGDDLGFNSLADYEQWLRGEGKWNDDAARVVLTGQMGVADSLVAALEAAGAMVYPVNSIQLFIKEGHADSIAPSAMINMAHGRMGDMVVDWLRERNIPLFSPLNVNRDYDGWMADKQGMSGGFLSQSVVTPEIDGAIRPYALFAHFDGTDGLPYVGAIPGRLNDFVASVDAHVRLQSKPAEEKRVAIFYFKGPGQSALVAEGMEVAPSLYNLLLHLRSEGYRVDGLPGSVAEFGRMIERQGKVFNTYAVGAKEDFVRTCNPEIIAQDDYDRWCADALDAGMRADIDATDGVFPGSGLSDGSGNVALACLRFGNVVLIPQPAAGTGDDDFKIVHGTDAAPPHNYVAAYMWARYGFGADALVHFGAHGSLEFTPRKQVALASTDWPDRLVGPLPHIYVYSTSNVGEAMTAKRRSYATVVNYLTPPFLESGVRDVYRSLTDAVSAYNNSRTAADSLRSARLVKKHTMELGIHRELRLDSTATAVYDANDIARIENFAEELANEKIAGALYVMGRPYDPGHIRSTVEAMTIDPIACSLQKLRGGELRVWRDRAKAIVESGEAPSDALVCRTAAISQQELDSARMLLAAVDGSRDMLSRMMVMGAMMKPAPGKTSRIADRPATTKRHGMLPGMSPDKALAMARSMGASPEAIKKMEAAIKRKNIAPAAASGHPRPAAAEFTPEQLAWATAIGEVERALSNIDNYGLALMQSPAAEMAAVANALAGGYVEPSSGGDPVLNPDILPTGRNMYAINAEETPSAAAWEKGKELAEGTIRMYREAHGDSIPRKVSYTLWSSEFIETEGATIAQVLYMLGIEPVRDPFGRVTDLRLIPSAELGRPRIDVVVQTSGQLRDLAASRLFLISRAVRMAAEAEDKEFPNYVAEGVVESERVLVDKGVAPKDARSMASMRVFGGVGGSYGSGIQSMVESGDRWTDRSEIARTYINNMGASYGSEQDWEQLREHAFEAALTRTDVVVQPRQSNTWGALSLDHVYEFMGGMNLAVGEVTGKEPDAYLADYRNRNRVRMQEVKEAIGVESRTTILNPVYIRGKMQGGAGDAAAVADIVRNTYGWNVMKPDVIDNELWNDIYDTYVADRNGLGVKDWFRGVSPAAAEEITAVMLETARKGMWQASEEQLRSLARMHTEFVVEAGPSCSGFVCDNAALRDFIASKTDAAAARDYNAAIGRIRAEQTATAAGKVLQKQELAGADKVVSRVNGALVAIATVIALIVVLVVVRRRRKRME